VSAASDTLRGLDGPGVDELRKALTAARDAASGDDAKIEEALERLEQAQ
jgi:hypothetical protein